jgi:hypothetical protein
MLETTRRSVAKASYVSLTRELRSAGQQQEQAPEQAPEQEQQEQ